MTEPLAIVRVGLCSPVGLNTAQTATALRAGAAWKTQTSIVTARREPVVMGHLDDEHLPELDPRLDHAEGCVGQLQRRLLRLAGAPLQEVLADYPGDSPPPLYLAGPQPVPGQPEIITDTFLGHLATQARRAIDVGASRLFASGHAGLFAAVAAAQDELLRGRAQLVIVGGVDSYLDFMRLRQLDRDGRLQTSGPRDTFTPGEAAAFLLLASRASCRRHGLRPLAWIAALGLGHEPGHRYSDEPLLGDGLAAAVSATFEQLRAPLDPVRLVLAGLNGENLRTKEWTVAMLRNSEHFAEQYRVEHAAEYTGDAGAALAPLMLGAAAFHMHRGNAEGPALLWASSDQGQRGALLMHANT